MWVWVQQTTKHGDTVEIDSAGIYDMAGFSFKAYGNHYEFYGITLPNGEEVRIWSYSTREEAIGAVKNIRATLQDEAGVVYEIGYDGVMKPSGQIEA
ncbi:MAG: hypothetical protein COW32_07070 [Candidatus Aquicultor secundus]|uniref:Uncharacterized protein n=1 Tax=Candidatus Aquicultor secundus TaxID=1973895 RepID=A0A2M7T6X7_9ACTN|nr:hypothetical protein [Candidatus Aquicultor secundus]NCO65102.1 hypothetical protein [Solirubrobacter sp.]OIO88226.1 MAG: hypothetical protein AUK32_01940 [Candidatus Aquicultor secundus]PIU27203.1 MAG: hypothetical protein COT10_04745 [Candidatus Aquicultor secundus]PIW21971.1 MAG: hypothetical protein COW32_07070 [Candidatus Aquicultor secundus]PIX51348.1 MAG: hypothetical protein COZ51_10115 [Candidatus Aquicultor secundus]